MAKAVLPITLQIGNTSATVAEVELPITTDPLPLIGNIRQVNVRVDHGELWRRIAEALRAVADEFEKGPTDADQ